MLTRIDLRHFKCFEDLKLPLCSLTLLSGTNAAGKSAVIQALVLLHQTMHEHEWSLQLKLNGTAIRLGFAADVIDKVHGRRECGIELLDDESVYGWIFSGEREDMVMHVSRVAVNGVSISSPDSLQYLLPPPHGTGSFAERIRDLTYLTAERLGPRETYRLEDAQAPLVIGSKGERAISVYYTGQDSTVADALVVPGAPPTLQRQVEARMARFFPGCGLIVEKIPRTNAVTLGIRTSADTDFHRPIHTGFGLTQVLPIIIAALSANEDDLLLIENPEVHLHPAGQAAIGVFLAEVAAAGIQVLIETHSDHVLNGIRRAIKAGILPCSDVALHFFRPRREGYESGEPQVLNLVIDPNGNVDSWPEGFFDQFDNDMNYLAGWS